jgi:inner membrane protein
MQSFNHIAGGITFTGLFASFSDINIFEKPEYIAITIVAAILPDIDHTKSLIGKAAYPLAKWISIKFGHRTVTHSLLFLLGILLIVKFLEIMYGISNKYSTIVFYALLSHNVFDMVTKQGVAFWYPISTRPCVLPGNPGMRLRTNDLKSEAIIFVIFCSLILFCQPLFANGFWQQYNKTFLTYSHIERETRRRTDYLNVKFLNAQKDTIGGMHITDIGSEFIILKGNNFEIYPKEDCKFVSLAHSGKQRKPKAIQIINVSTDSLKKHLKQPILKLQIQSNVDLTYFDGVAQKTAKTIEKEYVSNFDFFTQAPDNTKDAVEIQTLEIRIREEQSRYNREIQIIQNEIADLKYDFRTGESRFPSMSDYEKGNWVRKRQDIKSDIEKLTRDISRKIPPGIEADLIRLNALKGQLNANEEKLSANITIL